MAKENVTKMPKNEKTAKLDKLGSFISTNKVVLYVIAAIIVAGLIAFFVTEKVIEKNTSEGITKIELIEHALLDNAEGLSDSELADRYTSALNNLSAYSSKGGIVGARADALNAEIFYRQNDFEKARASYLSAAKKAGKNYFASLCRYNAASASEELNDVDKALELYEIVAADENFADPTRALFAVGRIKESKLDFNGAKEAYEKILAKNNNNDQWANLAKTRVLSLQNEGKIE